MNKILWVILSISLLCLVVILSSIWILNAKAPGGAATTASAELPVNDIRDEYSAPVDPFSHTIEDMPLPGLEEPDKKTAEAFSTVENRTLGDLTDQNNQKTTSFVDPGSKIPSAKKTTSSIKNTSTTSPVKKSTSAATVQKKSYYIQTGAYKYKSNADENNATLTEIGLSGRIIKSTKYYTVLIGPYATKAEAQKFLSWIKEIKGMENSYVTYKP